MFKVILISFLLLFFTACGVETSSSAWKSSANGDGNVTDPDNNVTDPDDNTTDPDIPDNPDDPTSIFDTVNAIYDANACNANFYRVVSDASYAGNQTGENGAGFYAAEGQGLEIRSEHLEAEVENLDKTWVSLYYKSFPDPSALNKQGLTSYLMDGVFYLTYDMAWSDESVAGLDNTLYVKTLKNAKPFCYRLVLNTAIGSMIDVQKVYR